MLKIRMKQSINIQLKYVKSRHHNDPRAYIEYSNDMHNVYKNINYYSPDKKNKILIVFDDMIIDMIHSKKQDSILTELFVRGRKLNISLCFYYPITL